jgi:REP element-mobilizing transposase RayT
MSGTFTQMLVHIVFSTKRRKPIIREQFREELQMIISGIVRKRGQKLLAIYCMPDHTHILIGLNGEMSVAALVRDIKSVSSRKINEAGLCPVHFSWQEGYGAFTHNSKDMRRLVGYVLNQVEHHKSLNFEKEYVAILAKNKVAFDLRYVFG